MVEAQEKTSKDPNECPECGHSISEDFRTGDIVCRGCGLVHGKLINPGDETRSFNKSEWDKRKRTGPPIVRKTQHLSLTSYISFNDINTKNLTPKSKAEFHRLVKFDNIYKSRSSLEKNTYQSNIKIDVIAGQLQLSEEVRNIAAIIYRKALLKKMIKGRSIQQLVAAALYTACKIHRIVVSLNEFERVSLVSRKKIWRAYGSLVRAFNIKDLVAYKPIDYLSQIITSLAPLKLSSESATLANKILLEFEQKNSAAKDQRGVAAAALYCAAKITHERLTQKDLAAASSVTEATIRNNAHTIQKIIPIGGFKRD